MTQITVTKREDGKLDGFTDKDQRAYARFRSAIEALEQGELFQLSTWFPRNPKLHRLHFGTIKAFYEAQDRFDDAEPLRKWLYVGAGHADFVPGAKGETVAIPKSIAYDKIDDADFSEIHRQVVSFMRSEHCRRFLWGHLSDTQSYEMVEQLLQEFDRG